MAGAALRSESSLCRLRTGALAGQLGPSGSRAGKRAGPSWEAEERTDAWVPLHPRCCLGCRPARGRPETPGAGDRDCGVRVPAEPTRRARPTLAPGGVPGPRARPGLNPWRGRALGHEGGVFPGDSDPGDIAAAYVLGSCPPGALPSRNTGTTPFCRLRPFATGLRACISIHWEHLYTREHLYARGASLCTGSISMHGEHLYTPGASLCTGSISIHREHLYAQGAGREAGEARAPPMRPCQTSCLLGVLSTLI
ncbi:uncharacterized protein LOC118663247 [Myotis myotis]|uniref:uncharacterized protein LOC118663247 n=1 Tax=Myotis myotis TaxID=51298 RepID=UPI00174992E6|nr:uncharacterized protein LOC118663247 [Myotis myotis]